MILLFFIYIAFIGLGLPDSMFGTAWPAIYMDFNLPFGYGSIITTLSCVGTLTSSILSAGLIKRMGTGKVTAVSTALTAFALLGYSLSGNFVFMVLCAIPLGLGAGSVDTALNNYVAIHYSARQMSFLHCFYGIGITISPIILADTLAANGGWRSGYMFAFCIQLIIAALVTASLPLWKRSHSSASKVTDDSEITVIKFGELIRMPFVKSMWLLFFASCSIECICSAWCSTYLVEILGMTPDAAASRVIFYFAGIAVGRFVSGLVSNKLSPLKIITIGLCLLSAGIITVLIPWGGNTAVTAGLFLIGTGNGPLFPNFNYLTPRIFGERKATSVIGSQMAAANLAFLCGPVVFAFIANTFGIAVFPWALFVSLIVLIAVFVSLMSAFRRGKISFVELNDQHDDDNDK